MDIKKELYKMIEKETGIQATEKNINKNFKEFGIDSLKIMELILKIEENFNTTLPDDELVKIKTLNDLIMLLEKTKGK